MKRIFKCLPLLGAILTLQGCLHEKYDKCPMEGPDFNVTLNFHLSDGNGGCCFLRDVAVADLCVYDESGTCVKMLAVSQAELAGFKGVRMTLPAGEYHVVGWGNIASNCKRETVSTVTSAGEYVVTYTDKNGGKVGSTDRVFYAPLAGGRSRAADVPGCYMMTVDPQTGHNGTLEFTAAHRTIKVYVEGYSGTPAVEFADVPEGLTWFGMGGLTDDSNSSLTVTASQITAPLQKEGTWYDYAEFNTFYFDGDNTIVLSVVDPLTGDVVYTIPLNEVLEDATDPTEIVISIVIRFGPLGVEVSLPDWNREGVDPGVGH